MLGKSLKYDLKALSRYLLLLHAFAIFFTLAGRLFLPRDINWDNPSIFIPLYILAMTLILVTVSSATYIIIGVHFYRNLFSRHGYLTWTLPVSSAQHLLSKFIAGFIWAALDFLIMIGCALIFISAIPVSFQEVSSAFEQELGMSLTVFSGVILVVGLFGCIYSLLSIYVSISIGQLFSSHRVLAALITYGATYMIMQFISSTVIFLAPNGMMSYLRAGSDPAALSANIIKEQYTSMMILAAAISIIFAIVCYIITHIIMKKKLNLM